jgi:hypothetical protein
VEIHNEDDLFAALERLAVGGTDLEGLEVEFVGWPTFEITIRGEKFDGGVPTRIMPALLALQKQMDTAYANLKYGDDRRLSKDERRQTELVVRFEAGRSTTFLSELWPILNSMAQQAVAKMDGTQDLIAILAIAGMTTAGFAWKVYLNSRIEQKKLGNSIELSREETRRSEILASAIGKSHSATAQLIHNQAFQNEVLKRLAPEDQLVLGDIPVIDGESAHEIVRKQRSGTVESRMDGNFYILSVDSGLVRGGFRLKVTDIETGEDLLVSVPEGTLTSEQIGTLQSGEWGKKPLTMKLNIKKSGERVIGATLIEAGLSKI